MNLSLVVAFLAGAFGMPAVRAEEYRQMGAGHPGYKGESMKTAREVAEEILLRAMASRFDDGVTILAATIEADRREVVEACARAAEKSYRNDAANWAASVEMDHYDPVSSEACIARKRAADDIRSLSPKGTTPAAKEVTRG